jgi:hypothetical protein
MAPLIENKLGSMKVIFRNTRSRPSAIPMIYRTAVNGTVTAYPFSGSTDRISSLALDKNNNLYLGTQGLGAQIFKVSF